MSKANHFSNVYSRAKKIISFLLVLSFVFGFISTFFVYAAGQGDTKPSAKFEQGYISNIEFFFNEKNRVGSAYTEFNDIFQTNKTEYTIAVPFQIYLSPKITLSEDALKKYVSVIQDGKVVNTKRISNNAALEWQVPLSGWLANDTSDHYLSIAVSSTKIDQAKFTSNPTLKSYDGDVYNFYCTPIAHLTNVKMASTFDDTEYNIDGFNQLDAFNGANYEWSTKEKELEFRAYSATFANLLCQFGNNSEWNEYTSNEYGEFKINLDLDAAKINDNTAKITTKVILGGIEKVNSFTINLIETNPPVITKHPTGGTYAKGVTPTPLSIEVQDPDEENVTYQWQRSSLDVKGNFSNIEGANEASYAVPASSTAGTYYYRCLVSREIDGVHHIARSQAAKITTELTYVSDVAPVEGFGFGEYGKDKNGNYTNDIVTEYIQGQKFNPILMQMPIYPETGTEYRFELFYGTSGNIEEAKPYEDASIRMSGTDRGTEYTVTTKEGIGHLGEFYVFCKVTAVSLDGTKESAPYIGKLKLNFVRNTYEWPGGGEGTLSNPYRVRDLSDLGLIRSEVNDNANQLTSMWFQLQTDITLPEDWTPIGTLVGGNQYRPFAGYLDGNGHKITISRGGKPLFQYVRDTKIKDLDIYGEEIDGCGLINSYFADYGADGDYWTGVPDTAALTNVRLLSGSSTRRSGLMEGSGSGANTITMRNCEVEKGVTIGYTGTESGIGSFCGGAFNGNLQSCYSYAEVKGKDRVGGLVGGKGQSMGQCSVTNSGFGGTINATGDWVGGIIGKGYTSASAPNTMPVSFNNCYVSADITANDYVGGIFGGEQGLQDAVNSCILSNSSFYGSINASGTHVGGIIGHYQGVNTLQEMENNYYYETSKKSLPVIGSVGRFLLSGSKNPFADQNAADVWYKNAGHAMSEDDYASGKVKELLNTGSGSSLKNWIQDTIGGYPVHSGQAVVTSLNISGELTTKHYTGDKLNLTGLTFTAVWSDGTENEISAEEIEITGYDLDTSGSQNVKATYGAVSAEFTVIVYKEGTITVKFALYGDTAHGSGAGVSHTLSDGNLTRWIPAEGIEGFDTYIDIPADYMVKDIVEKAVGAANVSNPSGNYIESITWNGVKLGEFTNGPKSGWMYTINGVHSDKGVNEQDLNDGDVIVFHYTDDYTKDGKLDTPGQDTPVTPPETLPDFRQALKDTLAYIAQTVPAPAFGTTSGEWSVLALARGGYDPGAGYFDEYYDRIVKTVTTTSGAPKLHAQKSTENSRLILALSAIGRDPQNVGGVNLLTPLADMDWVEYQGVNGPIWALIALDARNYPNPGENTRQKLIDRIISNQLGNGGFSITPGGEVDLDMTAMALQALAPYKGQDKAGKAIDRALAYLSSVQNSSGGFGNTSEANVQVIVALSALGIDPKSDPRFVKPGGDPVTALLNYAVGNGGFKHLMTQTGSNAMATDQAGYALVAYTRMLDGQKGLYDMTDVELAAAGTVEITVEPEVNGTTAIAAPNLSNALDTAKTENKDIISVTVSEKKADKVAVILNSITANAIAEANKTLNVTTENGGLSIAHQTLKSIAEQAAQIASVDEIVLNVERKKNEDEAVKTMVTNALAQIASSLPNVSGTANQASIVEVTITVNDQKITQFGGNTLSIDLPVSSDLYTAGKVYKTLVISEGSANAEEISGRCRDVNGKRVVTVRTTHLSTFVVIPVLASAEPVEPEKPEKPGGNGEIDVRITILGDSVHGETSNPHTLAGNNLDTWVSQTTYTLKEGSTVWDLLKKVFNDNGMTCSNPSGNYVESITWRGKTLGEFTNGKYSGWMYTLNGTHPSLGVSEQVLEDGDRVVWHYTDDYTKEQGSEKWAGAGAKPELETGILQPLVTADKNGVALAELAYYEVENMIGAAKENNWKELIIQPKVEGTASKIGIVLSKDITSMITDKSDLSLSLHTKYGNASLTNAGLTELSKTMKESLTMSVEKTETGTVKVDVLVDGKRVNTIKDGLRVTIPVEENGNVIAIIENGTEKIIRKSIVDGRNLLAVMDGSCELKVLDNSKSFGDIEGHWAKDAVAFASSHELFNGTGPERFEPDTSMSRAMLATVLYRLEDAVAEGSNPFADVASGTWYTDAVIWASANGIVNGTGSGFAPDRNVTRQELVAMLYRYANSIGMDTGNTGSLDKFTDRNSVAEWARDAMSWAVANGLVNGRTATTLAPEGTATRAEVAAITQRLVTLMVK